MKRVRTGLAIVGGGCAGLAAAVSARENGVEDVLVLERHNLPGGINELDPPVFFNRCQPI